jgi:hypothetical protein
LICSFCSGDHGHELKQVIRTKIKISKSGHSKNQKASAYEYKKQKNERDGEHSGKHFLVAHLVVRVNRQHFPNEGRDDRFHEVNVTPPPLQINVGLLQGSTVFST